MGSGCIREESKDGRRIYKTDKSYECMIYKIIACNKWE